MEDNLIINASFRGPVYKSELVIHPNLCFQFEADAPSRWVQFWQKFLLGWEWRKL